MDSLKIMRLFASPTKRDTGSFSRICALAKSVLTLTALGETLFAISVSPEPLAEVD
ncbi:hypothetical protein ACFL0H_06755 [Thermodesulfobacteriota bacterium]